jgi:hypothetical protein
MAARHLLAANAALCALLALALPAPASGEATTYVPLGVVTQTPAQVYQEGRQYNIRVSGHDSSSVLGDWDGATSPLGQFGWLAHPPLSPTSKFVTTAAGGTDGRMCDTVMAAKCQHELDHCYMFEGKALETVVSCHCVAVYFSQCMWAAGCATEYSQKCYYALKHFGCSDTTMCGNNCMTRVLEPGRSNDKQLTLQVNNEGMNYLRVSTCNATYDETTFERFGEYRERKCAPSEMRRCPYWIPPRMLTSLTIDPDTTYLIVEQCAMEPGVNARCLESPRPVEVRGTRVRWPALIEVQPTLRLYCDKDADCPGSYCVKSNNPPHICKAHELNASTFPGFTQGGNPHQMREDFKVLIEHADLDDENYDAMGAAPNN